MAVRKRAWTTKDGETKSAFLVDYYDRDGDRHFETKATMKEAKDRMAEIRLAMGKGTHTAARKSQTVAQACERWLKKVEADGMRNRGALEKSTTRQYKQHINLHIVPRIGETKLADLNPKVAEDFQQSLLKGLSRPLAKKVFTSFKSALKASGYSHAADGLSIGTEKRKRRLEVGKDIPTPDEVRRLIAAVPAGKKRALLLTVALTGLRASELRGLRWKDVDLKAGVLHVRQRADRFNQIGAPKSDSSTRTVPLDPGALIPALREWKVACPKGDEDLVFPSSSGAVEHHKNMLKGLASVMKAAHVVDRAGEPKYALHAFRHFFASWCINAKAGGGRELPPKEVQTLLGHSSIVMTLDRYGHLFPRNDDRSELAASAKALLG